jgi:hypothetical protein
MINEYEATGEMRTGGGNRSTRRKPVPVPLCPPQIPQDLTWDRTRAAAVGRYKGFAEHNISSVDTIQPTYSSETFVPHPLSQDSQYSSRDSKRAPHEWMSDTLPQETTCSVKNAHLLIGLRNF